MNDIYAELWRPEGMADVDFLLTTYCSHSFPRHMHDTYVLQVIEQGVNQFHCSGKNWVAHQGSVVVIAPGEMHTGHSPNGQPLTYRSIYPSTDKLHAVFEQITGQVSGQTLHFTPVIEDPLLARQLLQMHKISQTTSLPMAAQTFYIETMAALISRHARQQIRPVPTGGEKDRIELAKEFLYHHLTQKIVLDDVAASIGLSPFHFLRVFRNIVGMTPHEYLISIRVESAKQLLRTHKSIAETALATGFSDQSHLTRYFKKIVGVTPGHFQKR